MDHGTAQGWAGRAWVEAINVAPVDHPHGYLARTDALGVTEFRFLCVPCAKRLTPVEFVHGLMVGNILPAPDTKRAAMCYQCVTRSRA